MKKFVSLFFIFMIFTPLFSQEKDDKTDIILPPMFLDIEDSTNENISTFLPDYSAKDFQLPKLNIKMAEPKDMDIDDILERTISVDDNISADNSKYVFDANIGIGSMLYLLGDFNITRIDDLYSLKLGFKHESRDGYNFNKIREGFFDRADDLNFSFSFNDKVKYRDYLSINFKEKDIGLQKKISEYDSITDRYFNFSNNFSGEINSILTIYFDLNLNLVDRRADYATSDSWTNTIFSPALKLKVGLEKLNFIFKTEYVFDADVQKKRYQNYFDLSATFDYELPHSLVLYGGFGIFWSSASKDIDDLQSAYNKNLKGISFPFSLNLRGTVKDFLQYGFGAGFENSLQKWSDISDANRYINCGQGQELSGWFAQAYLKYFYKNIFSFYVDGKWGYKAGSIEPNLSAPNSLGLFDYSFNKKNLLFLGAGIEVKPIEEVWFSVNWRGELLKDIYWLVPEHQLDFSFNYKIPQEWFGGAVNLLFEKYETSYIPEIDLLFYFKVDKNVKLNFELTDLLAPIYKEGRPHQWGTFIKPGFNGSIFVSINY